MTKRALKILGSPILMTLLFLIFIITLIVATFIDASAPISPSPYTKYFIYQAKWFEFIIILFGFSFFAHSLKFKLFERKNWSTLMIHYAFIIIIIGAGVTRYIGYEGIMNIREGEESNIFYSYDQYLHRKIDGFQNGDAIRITPKPQLLSLSERFNNDHSITDKFGDHKFKISIKNYIKKARIQKDLIPIKDGIAHLKIVENNAGIREDHYLPMGNNLIFNNEILGFQDNISTTTIQIFKKEKKLFIKSFKSGIVIDMITGNETVILPNTVYPLRFLQLYNIGETAFVVPQDVETGLIEESLVHDNSSTYDGIQLEVTHSNHVNIINLLNTSLGNSPEYKRIEIDNHFIHLAFGSKQYNLPFVMRLDNFDAKKFPGNENAYKSFKSQITIDDNIELQKEIAMNQVLDHRGFRFFQASFDNDEKGTYFSVNHDFWGTWISYIGYFLLFMSLIFMLFNPNSRFQKMVKSARLLRNQVTILFMLFMTASVVASDSFTDNISPSYNFIEASAINKTNARLFGHLVIQDDAGRMKPVNTYATDLLNKISKRNRLNNLNAEQAIFSMFQFPEEWTEMKILYIKNGNDSIRKVLQLPLEQRYAALNDFYNENKKLRIPQELVQEISKGFNPNQFEKDILRVYQNQYLLGTALRGKFLKLFPLPNDPINKWVSYPEFINSQIDYGDPSFIILCTKIFNEGKTAKHLINDFITKLKGIQEKFGSDVIPSKEKIKAEVFYNKLGLFHHLFEGYLILGILLLIISIFNIFWTNRILQWSTSLSKGLIFGLVILHFAGLAWRWYLSGHAPWSDAYESMIYVSFATMLFGLLFGRASNITIAASAFVTSMILMVAQWNFIDPAIANLQPVLDSYWLMIHVAVIVGSYGPFTVSMILGIIYLVLIILQPNDNNNNLKRATKEIRYINEMSLTIGLIMLVIGNFLGAMWANESWGRYWGWDPKETWALISILIYSFILHMRFIPKFRGDIAFNIASVFAYYSILMTYFGVNFYMTGLHSYANGDKVVTPQYIWISFGILCLLATIAYYKSKNQRNEASL